MHPIKVCFYIFFPAGGIGRYTYELLRALSNFPELLPEVLCTPDYQWKEATEYTTWPGLKSISHANSTLRRLRFLRGQFLNPKLSIQHAIEEGANIIHFSNINHFSFPYWKRLLDGSDIRIAISVHDVRRQKSIINNLWEDRQLKAIYHYAHALFVHSEYQADELVDFAGVSRDKIHLVPHGPYPHGTPTISQKEARVKLGLPLDKQVALFFGQIRDEKNLDQLIDALRLSSEKPHLVVAGQREGDRHRDVDYYRRYATRAGVGHLITFISRYILDEEVIDLFTAADWIALTYSNTFTSQSGVLNVAAHYERPVLVSSSPVLQETVNLCDIGVVCKGDSAQEIAEGMERLCKRVRDGHVHSFSEYRARFSWLENARITLGVYKTLLGRS